MGYKQCYKAEHHAYDYAPHTDFGAIRKDYPQSHRLVGILEELKDFVCFCTHPSFNSVNAKHYPIADLQQTVYSYRSLSVYILVVCKGV